MVKIYKGVLFIFLIIFCFQYQMPAQNATISQGQQHKNDFSATLENDILVLENSHISRTYKWNKGNIITLSISDKISGKVWRMDTNKPDLTFPGQTENAENAIFSSRLVPETAITPEHLVAEISYTLDKLGIKRVFRIYRNISVIACDLFYRGESTGIWQQSVTKLADQTNLEKLTAGNAAKNSPVIEKIELPGKHWDLDIVEFSDITDGNNTLVFNVQALSYRPNLYRGNILFAHDNTSDNGIFILKEAPTSSVQLAYPGGDFITEYGKFLVIGAGLSPSDLDREEWKRGYGFVTGVYSGNEIKRITALREYQKSIRIHKPGRDEMILMNTWGDRGQDTRVREKFALAELEAGAKLGITHFQIDDGWQKGRSSNSAIKGGSLDNIWRNNDYWKPDTEKFPSGLDPVVKRGKELGIEVCLWFNPSHENSNENWEKDANVLIGMYKNHGIRTFKIDGVNLPDKMAEINFRKFLEKVSKETDNNVVFNLDVTAARRGGYHYFNEYGNLFLENRYTDWQNYYPYTTLRNLWMLAKYVPPQNLQIEFLNKWRNPANYNDDPFAPANYSFEYIFAITMAAQPLAWFEATGLPEEAFAIAPVIKKYKDIQFDFHSGNIFPIGEEPDGKSWSGFQSLQLNKGYLLIFREADEEQESYIQTWLPEGTKIRCTPILGNVAAFTASVGKCGSVMFKLNNKNSYALYSYIIE